MSASNLLDTNISLRNSLIQEILDQKTSLAVLSEKYDIDISELFRWFKNLESKLHETIVQPAGMFPEVDDEEWLEMTEEEKKEFINHLTKAEEFYKETENKVENLKAEIFKTLNENENLSKNQKEELKEKIIYFLNGFKNDLPRNFLSKLPLAQVSISPENSIDLVWRVLSGSEIKSFYGIEFSLDEEITYYGMLEGGIDFGANVSLDKLINITSKMLSKII